VCILAQMRFFLPQYQHFKKKPFFFLRKNPECMKKNCIFAIQKNVNKIGVAFLKITTPVEQPIRTLSGLFLFIYGCK